MVALSTIMALSTGHLAKEVSEQLTACTGEEKNFRDWRDKTICCSYPEGHFVSIPPEDKWQEFPESLQDCFAFATRFGAAYLNFDRDNERVELRYYDW